MLTTIVPSTDDDGCYPNNSIPTIVSSAFMVFEAVLAVGVGIAGSYVAFKRTKEKRLAKLINDSKTPNYNGMTGDWSIKYVPQTLPDMPGTNLLTIPSTESLSNSIGSASTTIVYSNDKTDIGNPPPQYNDNHTISTSTLTLKSTSNDGHDSSDNETDIKTVDHLNSNYNENNNYIYNGHMHTSFNGSFLGTNATKLHTYTIPIQDSESRNMNMNININPNINPNYNINRDRDRGSIDSTISTNTVFSLASSAWENKTWAVTFMKFLPKEILSKKKCYFPIITQIIDEATDIAVVIQFYKIYEYETKYNQNCPSVSGKFLFFLSLSSLMLYRIVSCIWVYNVTGGKWFDTSLQFFDLKLYHALYINFLLHKKEPNNPQRYLQLLEASLESFPQAVIQLYYLFKVGTSNYNSTSNNSSTSSSNYIHGIIYFSLAFSILNISTKMISEDKIYFTKDWQDKDIEYMPPSINKYYLIRFIIRLLDFVTRLLLILLTWIILDGVVVFGYLCFEFICLLIIATKTKKLSTLD